MNASGARPGGIFGSNMETFGSRCLVPSLTGLLHGVPVVLPRTEMRDGGGRFRPVQLHHAIDRQRSNRRSPLPVRRSRSNA
jgi:hypothetical protein